MYWMRQQDGQMHKPCGICFVVAYKIELTVAHVNIVSQTIISIKQVNRRF